MKKSWLMRLVCSVALVFTLFIGACGGNNPPKESVDLSKEYEHLQIQHAIMIAQSVGETGTEDTYVIVGTVKTVKNSTYGEMIVDDGTGELYIYGSMAEDGTYYDKMESKPVKGDQVVLKGVLMTYAGEPQMGTKNSKAIILDWYHPEVEIDEKEYKSVSIAEARAAEKETKVKVDGVVAAIAYANGKIPCGVILVDEGSSIYVYDQDFASQVKVGNKIEIAARKTYWILSTEEKNAALYGYQGACQLDEVVLLSNDNGSHAYDKSWIEETTIKQLMNTPFSENITTKLVKTTALVQKRAGTGFTNYYILDLDGVTGSYTYTQCNGSDFAWLDEYDGQICTVYMTAINAKSAPAECFYRFLPIEVEKLDGFAYPAEKFAEFALEYGVSDLFGGEYGSDPAIELPVGYSNELLGIDGVQISYSSSNETVATVTATESGAVLHLLAEGSCEITVTATAGGATATLTKTVSFVPAPEITTPTISEIIALADETKVQARGVVISSLVNRDGFYIGDETGMIAVLTSGDVLAQVKPGDEIVVEGYKVHHKKVTTDKAIGQCAIVGSVTKSEDGSVSFSSDSKLLANYYGNHDYSTSYAVEGKTIDELYAFDPLVDYSTNIYKVSAMVVVEETAFYTNIHIQDEGGANKLRLYSSSANQYSWLKAYAGQVVEMELALCNWNDKNYYTGCVISVTVDGVKTLNTLNFAK